MTTYYLHRIVIETTAPLAIYTGHRETGFDNQLLRDVNGLPYIPASTIAGVWRSIVCQQISEKTANQWFGFSESDESLRSKLRVSNGYVHNSVNKPILGIVDRQQITEDKVLSVLVQERPHHRERVRINDRGVAADQGKFDQLLLPAGCRFSINVSFCDETFTAEQQAEWQKLLGCWLDRAFAFGSSTRNGLGRFKIVGYAQEIVDLTQAPQATLKLKQFNLFENTPSAADLSSFDTSNSLSLMASLPLKAIDNWRCGSGVELLDEQHQLANPKIITYSEKKIIWTNNRGHLSQRPIPVLCGSSIKGILAHRVAFHYNRLTQRWAESLNDADNKEWETRPKELGALFGFADECSTDALAGALFVDDCELRFNQTLVRQHNSIDRFTGGVRFGALYAEELIYQPEFTLSLYLKPLKPLTTELIEALKCTLSDLKNGLLPIGAGSGRGTSLVKPIELKEWFVNLDALSSFEKTAVTSAEEA
jgi:CRISPR/Cas system CMR subunit Cmr4 (Cas7 group RAMP superfamily)